MFGLYFGCVGWTDGILRFFFRGGKVTDTDISD